MSSREIAELTGKRHDNVTADIRSMLDQLGQTSAEFSANLPDAYNRPQQGFRLPKDLTITLISGYSVPMRHKIVTRWLELEVATPRLTSSLGNPSARTLFHQSH
jgi:phage regulator Rha-like protein